MPGASIRPNMGAVPYGTGVTFRVWAPFATEIYVAGDFNAWSSRATPLASEQNGYWSADVEGAFAGQQYRFVIPVDGRDEWRVDPYAKEVTNSIGNGIIRRTDFEWGADHFCTPPWHELVIYELHTGTFNDEPGGKPGIFEGVCKKLSYLRELGVNSIQLLPAFEFATDFGWGYNPTHIFAVESAYGGPQELKRLVKTAHEAGVAVLLDVVYNHFGPSDLDHSLWRFDGWHRGEWGGIYFYNDQRAYTPWGRKNRPDYGRPEVRQFIRDNVRTWMGEFRVDGLRLDATSWIRRVYGDRWDLPEGWKLMQEINDDMQAAYPWKIIIAEDMRNEPAITRDTSCGGAGFDSQWDDQFIHPVRDVLEAPFDDSRDMRKIVNAIYHRYGTDALERVIYTESHDEVSAANGKRRVPTGVDWAQPEGKWAQKRSALGAVMVFTSPGIPMIFQGQEMLETRPFDDQVPVDWGLTGRFSGTVALYRDLIKLRRNWFDNTRGLCGQHVHVHHVNHRDKVIAFHRWHHGGAGDDVIVILNFSNRVFPVYRIGVPRSGFWRVRFNSDARVYSDRFDDHPTWDSFTEPVPQDNMDHRITIGIGVYSALILSQ